MTSYFETLLSETFAKCGEEPARAKRLAHAAMRTIDALEIIPAVSMDAFEMDAHVYDLKGKHVSQSACMERLTINKTRYTRAIKNMLRKRRAAMKAMDDDDTFLKVG